ncbi:MAG: pyridoxal-dependent decarboxylase [Lachnospiraceae bacterium]|nr:pyridoxal-dependent decarboxylase [Lachnospiraceae bacterium]
MTERELQTPCYVIHKDRLAEGIGLLKTSLEREWNHFCVGYSFKTNSLPYVVEEMKKAGFYAEVVSEDEYDLALKHGYEKIIYNGPVKGKRTFLHALEHGAIINLDAKRELAWLRESGRRDVTVGLRVNFNLEALCPGETSAGEEGSRFGFSYETGELKWAMDELDKMGIPLSGLHLHVGSKTRSVAIYRQLAGMACRLKREYDLKLTYIDLGGGYFGGMENRPKFPDYVKAIREELSEEFTPEETMLVMEPGTSLITPPIEYLTTVVDTKQTYANHLVVTDGSRIDVDPLHGKSSYFHKLLYQGTEEEMEARQVIPKQVVCGFTCMENDRLFVIEDQKKLQEGDRISFQKVGGYTICLTPLFIRYFPAVYVEENGEYRIIREAWTAQEYSQKSLY